MMTFDRMRLSCLAILTTIAVTGCDPDGSQVLVGEERALSPDEVEQLQRSWLYQDNEARLGEQQEGLVFEDAVIWDLDGQRKTAVIPARALDDADRLGEYEHAVFRFEDEVPTSLSYELNPDYEPGSDEEVRAWGQDCGAWSPWSTVNAYCDGSYWKCAFDAASFEQQERVRSCWNDYTLWTDKDYRTVFTECGC